MQSWRNPDGPARCALRWGAAASAGCLGLLLAALLLAPLTRPTAGFLATGYERSPQDGRTLHYALYDPARHLQQDVAVLPPDVATRLAWSPDGRQRVRLVAEGSGRYRLFLEGRHGEDPHELAPSGLVARAATVPVWSPRGDALVLTVTEPGLGSLPRIALLALESERLTFLTDGQNASLDPTWSPDGEWIAFAARLAGDWEILRVRPDGSASERLTQLPGRDASPAYAPLNGGPYSGMLAFLHEGQVWLMGADGAAAEPVADAPGSVTALSWSLDGRYLAMRARPGWLWLRDMIDGTSATVPRPDGCAQGPGPTCSLVALDWRR
jgi:hypothetical protein